MLISLALGAVWIAAAALSGLAVLRILRRVGALRFEALTAGVATALIAPLVAMSWVLLLPWRFAASAGVGAAVLAIASGALLRSRWCVRSTGEPRIARSTILAALPAAAVIAGAGAVSLYAAWIKPMWEIDGLLYHGPSIANLLQHGSLFGWDSPTPWIFYPNLAAVGGAAMAVVTRSLSFLDATQAPFLVIIGMVTWAWAGRGRPKPLVGAIAAMAVLAPAAFVQGRALYVDVVYCAALITGIWLVGLWISRRSRAYLALGMLFMGSAAAVKPAGVLITIGIAAIALLIMLVRRRHGWLVTTVAAIVPAVVGGAPFYLRNLIEFRNPLYPISVNIGGIHLNGLADISLFTDSAAPPQLASLPGPIGFFRNILYGITEAPSPIIYDSRIGAFGAIGAILGVMLLVAIAATLWPSPDRWGGAPAALRMARRRRGLGTDAAGAGMEPAVHPHGIRHARGDCGPRCSPHSHAHRHGDDDVHQPAARALRHHHNGRGQHHAEHRVVS